MRLFESDNVWKRRRRAQERSSRPDTPEQRLKDARQAMVSQLLWLFGAVLLVVLGLAGIRLGAVPVEPVTVGFLVVLALYALTAIGPAKRAYRAWKELLRP